MGEAEFALQFLVVAFDASTQIDLVDEHFDRHVLGQGREPFVSAGQPYLDSGESSE
jgi:hypothetical protein